MSVTRISWMLDNDPTTAVGVDTIKIAEDVKLPRLTIAFDQHLVELQAQSWDSLADLLDELETEVTSAKREAQREARWEADRQSNFRIGIGHPSTQSQDRRTP